MSQVSPDGQYVVTTVNPASMAASFAKSLPATITWPISRTTASSRCSIRRAGFWAGTAAQTGVLQPLPGADDPRFVQMGAVWSPDGQYLVFARAEATDPNPPGVPLAQFANDPNELQIQYDLYRIPFHNGEGGAPEPIAGASRQRHEQHVSQGVAGRALDRVRAMPQRAADASRQPVVHRSGGGRARRGACGATRR